jgi:glycosyltransferase involved in cell wall biosynthesis
MKILHLIYTHGVSGAEKHLKHLLPGLKAYGIDCSLMIVCPPDSAEIINSFADEFNSAGVNTNVMITKKGIHRNTLKAIAIHLKENGIGIIHSHLIRADIMAAMVKQFFFRKLFVISTKHGYQEQVMAYYSSENFKIPRNLFYYFTWYTLWKANKNISISQCTSNLFVNFKLTKELMPVIHHGVDVVKKDNNLQDKGFFRRADIQIVVVGLKTYPDCNLLIVGDGPLKNELEEKTKNLGIEKNVAFVGFQNDPYSYITNSDVIVIPSLFEPFGLVFIEAMALKTPLVAFDVPAGNELLKNKETGYLVPKFNSTEMAEKIISLLKDPVERERISNNAYQDYLTYFTTSTMVKNTAHWYLDLIKVHPNLQ